MKNLLSLALLGATTFAASNARADVSWQHAGRVTVGGRPVLTFDFRNQWSGDNHRTSLAFDASKLATTFGAPLPKGQPATGQIAFIERLGDDRLLFVASGIGGTAATGDVNGYVEEPYSTLRSRLRFNLFEGAEPELASELPPELTPAQRQRLGRELRAVLQPLARQQSRQYFRALPQTRVINGFPCRGYRYSTLTNIGARATGALLGVKGPQWLRATAEFWLAEELPGDNEIRAFTTRANALKTSGGPRSVSMWLNEIMPVLWESAPQETHAALAALVGAPNSPSTGFRGTPVQFFVTVTPPPLQMFAAGGDVRFALELKTRNENPVAQSTFLAPEGSKRQEIEPLLQAARDGIRQARTRAQEAMDGVMGGAPAPETTIKANEIDY